MFSGGLVGQSAGLLIFSLARQLLEVQAVTCKIIIAKVFKNSNFFVNFNFENNKALLNELL